MLSILMNKAGTEITRPWGYLPGSAAMGAGSTVSAVLTADVRALTACHGSGVRGQGTGVPVALSGSTLGRGGFTTIAVRPAGEPMRRLPMSWNPASADPQASEHADRHLILGSTRDPLPD
ncbi:glycerate kinase [Candidatus Frankia alpina]|uniref:Glycerate kinase n=1 Tax=Candidatus Frankia alpina TaxID=2699483 RepID=A0A4S5BA17_9ACTN|nr:glycerate kinase [Candidatus Frankia alpina]THJ25696.1 glycerate kinase [Candidatus Frankia alpina]